MTGWRGGDGGRPSRLAAAARMIVVVVGLLAMSGACSSSGGSIKPIGTDRPTSTAASSSMSSSTAVPVPATTSADATKAAILAAYRAAWADIDAVDRRNPVNDFDQRLANHMAGAELAQTQKAATGFKFRRQYLAGPPTDTSAAIVRDLVGKVAVVSDCFVDRSILMDGTTNQVLSPGSTERMLRNAKIELIAGDWKMTESSDVGVTCTVAY